MRKSLHRKHPHKLCGIYAIQNTKNGKIYIGQSTDIERRLRAHRKHIFEGEHPNKNINRDLLQYNADAFSTYILETDCTKEELNHKEYAYIREYRLKHELYNISGNTIPYKPSTLISRRKRRVCEDFGGKERKRKKYHTPIGKQHWTIPEIMELQGIKIPSHIEQIRQKIYINMIRFTFIGSVSLMIYVFILMLLG